MVLAVAAFGPVADLGFVVVAAALAVVGCVLGNIFAAILFEARAYGQSPFEIAASIEFGQLAEFVRADFQLLDLLFWPLAIYAATFFAKRQLSREEGLAIYIYENRPRHIANVT